MGWDDPRRKIIEGLHQIFSSRHLPVLVVHIPSKEELFEGQCPDSGIRETKLFAKTLHARFIDGSEAFAQTPKSDLYSYWLPNDGHWNEKGSNLFAQFMAPVLKTWLKENHI